MRSQQCPTFPRPPPNNATLQPYLEWEIKKKHIEEYVLRLQFFGYDQSFRKEIVKSAVNEFENIKIKVSQGDITKILRQKDRAKEKRHKKADWYKKKRKGDKKDFKSVLFVQPTKD